jgi:quercetin dioxygenase-like cupin family protein
MKRGKTLAVVLAATAVAAAIGLSAARALATPASGVSGSVLGQGMIDEHININPSRDEPSVVTVQKVTIQPGGTTGWHSHDAKVLAVVAAGTVTLTDHDCSERTVATGQGFVENPGHVHQARNLGNVPAEVYVTYVTHPGHALRVDAAAAPCNAG